MTTQGYTFSGTQKQLAILRAVVKGSPDGSFLDLDQLIEALPYPVTKQALQFSLRTLAGHGMLEKKEPELRRDRLRAVWAPTPRAYAFVRGAF